MKKYKDGLFGGLHQKVLNFVDTYIIAFYILLDFIKRGFKKVLRLTFKIGVDQFKTFDIDKIIEKAKNIDLDIKYHGFGLYEVYNEKNRIRLKQDIILDKESVVGLYLCGHKCLTFRILEHLGFDKFPPYRIFSFKTIHEARRDFSEKNRKVVVKPCAGTSGGRGITAGIENPLGFNKAIYHALVYDSNFIVEDFIEGDHYRLFYCNGNYISGLRRYPARVTGDGEKKLKDLIKEENKRRKNDESVSALFPIKIDFDMKNYLKSKNMNLNYVPRQGETVQLKNIVNLKAGGEGEDITSIVNKKIIDDCGKIVKEMKIYLAGIDIITKDIRGTEYYINEVNTTPPLLMHYKVNNPDEAPDVAHLILMDLFNLEADKLKCVG